MQPAKFIIKTHTMLRFCARSHVQCIQKKEKKDIQSIKLALIFFTAEITS